LSPRPDCEERQILMNRYAEATRLLAEVGAQIARFNILSESGTLSELWEQCEQTRLRCVEIRHEIAAHAKQHRCGLLE
jgi:hypothetical protein